MTQKVHDWLPREVLTQDIARETVEQAIARWSDRWFAGPHARLAALKPVAGDPRQDSDEAGWRLYRGAVALRTSRPALSRIMDRVLDITAPVSSMTEADEYVLTGLETRILDSLIEETERAFGLHGEAGPVQKITDPLAGGGGVLVTVTDMSGRDIVTLAIPGDMIVKRVKASLGPASPSAGPLGSWAQPLDQVIMAIETRVGAVELTMTELHELAVGDVLILDRTLDQAVDVASAGSHQIFARAMLTHIEDGVALVFSA